MVAKERTRLAVLGHPVAHSLSPAIHSAAFRELGIEGRWSYEAIDVEPAGFEQRVRGMESEGFAGANVTIPHKLAALAVADDASPVALEIGAANTLSFAAGRIRADNTDAQGLLDALPEDPRGRRALVLGAGGAARAVVWALVREGAQVTIWNRTPDRATELATAFGATTLATVDPRLSSADVDLIVNTTSVGLGAPANSGPENGETFKQLPITADSLAEGQTVVDLVYRPGGTELVRAARERGAAVVDGLEVLVRQGAASFRIWTGLEPPLEAMRRAAAQPERHPGAH